jgi:phosphoglycerol transferase MdoB-like AlkP superfamily enzyme
LKNTNYTAEKDSRYKRLINKVAEKGPVGPFLFFAALALIIFFVFRIGLSIAYHSRVAEEPHFWYMYFIGIRMDLIIISYLLVLPFVFFFLLPKSVNNYLKYFWIFYFTLFIDIIFFMEMATIPFLREYDLRPDSIFVRYLGNVKEVAGTVWKANGIELIITLILLVFVHLFAWRSFKRIITNYTTPKWPRRIAYFLIGGAVIFLCARSSFKIRPANISTAYFSDKNKLVNELTLNSTYSVFYAVLRLAKEKDPSAVYGKMNEAEMYQRIKNKLLIPDSAFVKSEIPFLHNQSSPVKTERPMNVVIVLEESLGAEYVGCLGGLPLTPNLDKLSKEGILFTDLYSTGTRTVRGIEATVSGFLPTPGSSVVNLGLSRSGFFTAASLFAKAGYTTEFIYGGQSNFDEMRSFFLGNGFQNIYDQPTFKNPVFTGTWGVSDEDLMVKADEVFRAHGDKPFFSLILSTSNHSPFEFPDGRIQLYDQPKSTVNNAMKYADYSIGKLFELAKKADYYKNTIFLVVADHNTRVFGDDFIPVHKFHIPGVLIGPGIQSAAFSKVASQIDLLPTILHFAGISTVNPMIGRDLMTVPANDPGRCFMQYGMNYGYMVGDSLVVLKPYLQPQGFIYNKGTFKLSPAPVPAEMAKDALAHSLLPWKLYESRKYSLP